MGKIIKFHMKNIEPHDFDEILANGKKNLVLFYADWCPYCNKFKPMFEIEEQDIQKIDYNTYGAKINEDENPLWERFNINAVPTVIAFEGTKIINRRDAKMGVGLTKKDLESLIKELNS